MKKTRAAGARRELQVKKLLEDQGYDVRKARVSLGPADLVATKTTHAKDDVIPDHREFKEKLVIQVKANKGNAFMNFRKDERAELLKEAEMCGGLAVLCHWAPHKEIRWLFPEVWPKNG